VLSVGRYTPFPAPHSILVECSINRKTGASDKEYSGICHCKWTKRHCHGILYPIHDCRVDDNGDWCGPTSAIQSGYSPVDVVRDCQSIPSSAPSLNHTRLGFQIVFGAGAGIGLELPNIAVQTVLPEEDVSIGTSLVVFARSLGGAIFVSVGQNIFSNHIVSGMLARVPELDPSIVLESGATDLQQTIRQATSGQANVVAHVLEIYNDAIVQTFVVALVLACVSIIGALGVEWRTVKSSPEGMESEQVD